jgi:hypothetical protein
MIAYEMLMNLEEKVFIKVIFIRCRLYAGTRKTQEKTKTKYYSNKSISIIGFYSSQRYISFSTQSMYGHGDKIRKK